MCFLVVLAYRVVCLRISVLLVVLVRLLRLKHTRRNLPSTAPCATVCNVEKQCGTHRQDVMREKSGPRLALRRCTITYYCGRVDGLIDCWKVLDAAVCTSMSGCMHYLGLCVPRTSINHPHILRLTHEHNVSSKIDLTSSTSRARCCYSLFYLGQHTGTSALCDMLFYICTTKTHRPLLRRPKHEHINIASKHCQHLPHICLVTTLFYCRYTSKYNAFTTQRKGGYHDALGREWHRRRVRRTSGRRRPCRESKVWLAWERKRWRCRGRHRESWPIPAGRGPSLV